MKKILLVALLVFLPMSVYALEPMSMDALGDVTAQEGVNINFGATEAGAVTIETTATSTAWTNYDTTTKVESGIVQKVVQSAADVIKVWGNLTIQAKTASDKALVEIGLPNVKVQSNNKRTDIFISSKAHGDTGPAASYDAFITDTTTGKLGSQYTTGATTSITGGTIQISAM